MSTLYRTVQASATPTFRRFGPTNCREAGGCARAIAEGWIRRCAASALAPDPIAPRATRKAMMAEAYSP